MPKIVYKEEVKKAEEPIPDSFYEIPKEEKKKTTRKKTTISKPIIEDHQGGIDTSAFLSEHIENLIHINPSVPELVKKSLCMCLKRVINTCKNGKWDNYMIHAQAVMDYYKITLEDIKKINDAFNKEIEEWGL